MLMTEHVLVMPQIHPTNQVQILIICNQWVAMPTRFDMKKVKMCSNKPSLDVVSEATRSSLRGFAGGEATRPPSVGVLCMP